jgi:intraflagellar transport protein 140
MDLDGAASDMLGAGETPLNKHIIQRTMREFVGLESSADASTREALINFSYYLTAGNMDEAFKAIKLIKRCACGV